MSKTPRRNSEKTTISVVSSIDVSEIRRRPADENFRAMDDMNRGLLFRQTEVDSNVLAKRLERLLGNMDAVLKALPETFGQFELESMTIDVEISAEGEVSLLGTGGKFGGKGGLSFILKKKQ